MTDENQCKAVSIGIGCTEGGMNTEGTHETLQPRAQVNW